MEKAEVLALPSEEAGERRQGDSYVLRAEEVEDYKRNGYIRVPGLLSEEEVDEIEKAFDTLTAGEVHIPGKDFCDMSQPFGVPFAQWRLVNVMLPRVYYPPLQGNILERRAESMARQLLGDDMTLDYDQLLLKRANNNNSSSKDGEPNGAVFAWHQDQAYWPQDVPDARTVTVSLAINDAHVSNGCLRLVPGSHQESPLRTHRPAGGAGGSREDGHALTVDLKEGEDQVVYVPVRRGDATLHDERIVHGSDGNRDAHRTRKTYVIAFRPKVTVEYERSIGFDHSHNTQVNWDSWISTGRPAAVVGEGCKESDDDDDAKGEED